MEVLQIEKLNFSYPDSRKNALKDITLSVNNGEFVVLCGNMGCGKTTLLKWIKSNRERENFRIGYVNQNCEHQIITDKVYKELAFGLENMGMPSGEMRLKIAEISNYFGINNWYNQDTDKLSGGQKQLLNLASVLVMSPDIVLLDEPTSQLDPMAAGEFVNILSSVNKELDTTIIVAEHRLSELIPLADRVLVMEKGSIIMDERPENIGAALKNSEMLKAMPAPVRLFVDFGMKGKCPVTAREGKELLRSNFKNTKKSCPLIKYSNDGNEAVGVKNVRFRYEKNGKDILKGLTFSVKSGEVYSLLGGNGTGKTTALKVTAGIYNASRGQVLIKNKNVKSYKPQELYRNNLSYLPQNVELLFSKESVREELEEIYKTVKFSSVEEMAERLELTEILECHPYDLSGGQKQKVALGKILLQNPDIVLLDEPSKSIDTHHKEILKKLIAEMKSEGKTVIIVTHDVEFAAAVSDRCGLLFDGEAVSSDIPQKFFGSNRFYTTEESCISRHMYENVVTYEQLYNMCMENR